MKKDAWVKELFRAIDQKDTNAFLGFLAEDVSFRFGNAVLSRFPITDAETVDFPAHSGFESFVAGKKRGLLCTLELPGKKPLRLLAVHLEHRSEAVRVSSARIIERARMAAKTPWSIVSR